MASQIISSNEKSRTEMIMTESGTDIPFYSAPKSMPVIGTQYQKVFPYINFIGAAANNSITWKLPAGAGFLYDSSIAIQAICTLAAGDITTHVGLHSVRNLEWISNGQPILSISGYALKALVKTLPASEQQFIYRYSLPLVPGSEAIAASGDTVFNFYIPLISSFLDEKQKCLLLNVISDLQLRVTFASVQETGLTNAITAVPHAILYCQTYMPKLSVYNEMVTNDWSKTLAMEMFNTYTEVGTLTNTTSATYTITCPFLVYRTHIYVEDIGGLVGSPYYNISDLTMNLGGVVFIDNFKRSRLLSRKSKFLGTNVVTTATNFLQDDNSIVTIDWGVDSTRHANTGTVFFQELRGTNLTVLFSAVPVVAAARLIVVHEYWNSVAYTPGSGGGGQLSIMSNN